MLTPLIAKLIALATVVLGLLCYALTEMAHPMRPATPQERQQVKQAVTGWGSAFARHK